MKYFTKYFIVAIFFIMLSGCQVSGDAPIHTYDMPNNVELNVPIEFKLLNGGTAKLICPLYPTSPMGEHGRECYLQSYSKGLSR